MQVLKLRDAGIRNAYAVEIEFFESRKSGDVFQAFVRHERVPKIQPSQTMHARKARHPRITECGIAQIERLQIDERGEPVLFDTALGAAKLLQLRERRNLGQTFIRD